MQNNWTVYVYAYISIFERDGCILLLNPPLFIAVLVTGALSNGSFLSQSLSDKVCGQHEPLLVS
jgi:hypothetical protein